MENKFIDELKWIQSDMVNLDCLYGYSHHSKGYFPYKEITEIINIGIDKKGAWKRKGIKGTAENGDKLYIMVVKNLWDKLVEKGWVKNEE